MGPEISLNNIIPALERNEGRLVVAGRHGRTETGFQQVRRDVDSVAGILEAAGARPGAHVGLLAENSYEWLLADLACLMLGCVSVPFDVRREWETGQLVQTYELAVLVTDAPAAAGPAVLPIAALRSRKPAQPRAPYRFAPREHYTVKFSSGTTGGPKAVRADTLHFDQMAQDLYGQFPVDEQDLYLMLMPFSTYLQRLVVYLHIMAGASVSVGPMEQAPKLLRSERPTMVVAVPVFLKSLLSLFRGQRAKNPGLTLLDLFGGRLRYLWTGTAPIDRVTLLDYENEGIPIYEGYGMTEIGLIAKNYPGARRVGSVGKVFPGKTVELGPAGEVIVRTDYLPSEGYWRGSNDGVYLGDRRAATGDVGRFDEDGFLYIVGRTKEMIVLQSGYKVFPNTVEDRLMASGPIQECILYGQGKPYLVALIVPQSEDVTDEALAASLARANQQAPPPEQVLAFLRVPREQASLRTAAGKLDRKAAHERFSEELQQLYAESKAPAT